MRAFSRLLIFSASWGCDAGTTPDPTEPPVCDPIVEGLWTASGPPFGMVMDTTVTLDSADCTFTTTDWNLMGVPMSHDSSMWGGLIDHDQVAVFGSTDFWDSCAGTLDQDGEHLAGVCSDAAAGSDWFEMVLAD